MKRKKILLVLAAIIIVLFIAVSAAPYIFKDQIEATIDEQIEANLEADVLYDEAVHFVTTSRRASISAVQRKLRIGYNRAARLIETMEATGVVTEMGHNGAREVLAPAPVE